MAHPQLGRVCSAPLCSGTPGAPSPGGCLSRHLALFPRGGSCSYPSQGGFGGNPRATRATAQLDADVVLPAVCSGLVARGRCADTLAAGTVTRCCCFAPAPLTRASLKLVCKNQPARSIFLESGTGSSTGELCRSKGISPRVGAETGLQSRRELGWKIWPVFPPSAKPAALFGERGARRQRVRRVCSLLAPRPSACFSLLRSCHRDSF